MPKRKPRCIFLVGLPTSGKTTFYHKYLSDYEHITTDNYIEAKALEEKISYKKSFRYHIVTACKLMAEHLINSTLAKKDVCIDLTNLTAENRYKKIRIIAHLNQYEMVAVHFPITKTEMEWRMKKRGPEREIPGEVLRSMQFRFEMASSLEGFAWSSNADNWEDSVQRHWVKKEKEIPF